MAKKKRGAKIRHAARRVGAHARKKAGEIDFAGIAMANAGGFLAALAIDKIDDVKTKDDNGVETLMFADKPLAPPLILEAIGIVGSMYAPATMKPLMYGIMGGAAAQAYRPVMDMIEKDDDGDAATNGTSTINASKVAHRVVQNVMQRKGGRLPQRKGPYRLPSSGGGGSMTVRESAGPRTTSSDMSRMGGEGEFAYLKNWSAMAGGDC